MTIRTVSDRSLAVKLMTCMKVMKLMKLMKVMMLMPMVAMLLLAAACPIQALSASDGAQSLVTTGQCFFPRLQFQLRQDDAVYVKQWDIWPIGDQNLRNAIRKTTNINILTDPVVVNLDHPEQLFQYPFVFMTSEGDFALTDSNRRNLREYLLRGGFLLADDCTYQQREDRFYRAWVREMRIIFPDEVVKEVPMGHEIFHCFFNLTEVPWVQGVVHPAMGVFDATSGRLLAFCTSGDIHCGWVGFRNLDPQGCQRCIEPGVNIMVYCLSH